jgi:hypothetical protein
MILTIPYPDIGSVALQLGPFAIRWYALAYITGLVLMPGADQAAAPEDRDGCRNSVTIQRKRPTRLDGEGRIG